MGNSDGTASIWSLNNTTGVFSQFSFGPYPNWTAQALSVGPDNTTHVLWDNTDGTAAIWNYSTATGTFTQNVFGPYPGWTAKTVADGPDGKTRVLWNNSDGTASIWSLNNTTGVFSQFSFGPYPNWMAQALSVGPDNTTHVLWDNTDGTAAIWNYSTATGTLTQNDFGPYPGWTALGLGDGPDGKTRVLWNNSDGRLSLWGLDNTTGVLQPIHLRAVPKLDCHCPFRRLLSVVKLKSPEMRMHFGAFCLIPQRQAVGARVGAAEQDAGFRVAGDDLGRAGPRPRAADGQRVAAPPQLVAGVERQAVLNRKLGAAAGNIVPFWAFNRFLRAAPVVYHLGHRSANWSAPARLPPVSRPPSRTRRPERASRC